MPGVVCENSLEICVLGQTNDFQAISWSEQNLQGRQCNKGYMLQEFCREKTKQTKTKQEKGKTETSLKVLLCSVF